MELTDSIKKFENELENFNELYFQTIKGQKTMAQTGSIEQISQVSISKLDEISKLINEYNQKGAEILMRKDSGEFKNYQPQYIQELVKTETEKHFASYEPKVEKLLQDSLSWLSIALSKKESIRFPLRSSVGELQKAQLGEMKALRAQSFISSTQNPNLLLNELFNAYRSNDDDYFNSLVNAILLTEPENEIKKSELLAAQPERVKLFADVRKVYNDFSKKNNLAFLEAAIQTLMIVATEVNQFLSAIKGKSIYFLPQRTVKGMDQNEVARQIEVVNGSAPFWETQLDSLNFVHQLV